MDSIRYTCKALPNIRIVKWADTLEDRFFYDLYIDDKYITRCDTVSEITEHVNLIILGG